MVLIYCVPFQCLWTEERETDDLEVRSVFVSIADGKNYISTRKLKCAYFFCQTTLLFYKSYF